jgi:hypothetical protein
MVMNKQRVGASARASVRLWAGLWAALVMTSLGACGAGVSDGDIATLTEAVCVPGDKGGDFGCGCTLNNQCSGFDDETRLLLCDVPSGGSVGKCSDCLSLMARPSGCACTVDGDCATGLKCNGRTCQALRKRGEFCVRDSDCGSDATGSMTCLPSKNWCGPLPIASFCDFNLDCLSGICSLGRCSTGDSGQPCALDRNCKAGLICNTVAGTCGNKLADGQPCLRNTECQNQCNSFSGTCKLGTTGTVCTTANTDGDCATGLSCVDCGGGVKTCRTGGMCS